MFLIPRTHLLDYRNERDSGGPPFRIVQDQYQPINVCAEFRIELTRLYFAIEFRSLGQHIRLYISPQVDRFASTDVKAWYCSKSLQVEDSVHSTRRGPYYVPVNVAGRPKGSLLCFEVFTEYIDRLNKGGNTIAIDESLIIEGLIYRGSRPPQIDCFVKFCDAPVFSAW